MRPSWLALLGTAGLVASALEGLDDGALSEHLADLGEERPGAGGVDATPPRASAAYAAVAALTAAALLPTFVARLPAVTGAVLLAAGAFRADDRLTGHGTALLVFGALVAGYNGGAPALVLAGALCAFLAWDSARYGARLAGQLGPDGVAREVVASHAALTALFGATVAILAYAVFAVGVGLPTLAAVLCLLGVVALVVSVA